MQLRPNKEENVRSYLLYILKFFQDHYKGLYGKALQKIWDLEVIDIRDSAEDKHKTVDDTPFGGQWNVIETKCFGKSSVR